MIPAIALFILAAVFWLFRAVDGFQVVEPEAPDEHTVTQYRNLEECERCGKKPYRYADFKGWD